MTTSVSLFDGATEHDVSAESYAVRVERGRLLELDDIGPGGGTIRVRNYNRNFDPFFLISSGDLLQGDGDALLQGNGDKILLTQASNAEGDYGAIVPGRKVVVKDGSTTMFTGFVEDYDYDWRPDKTAEATLIVRDGLAALSQAEFTEWTTTAQLSSDRVSAILDRSEIGYPSGGGARSISTGKVPLQSNTITTGTNALTELQTVARSEQGRLFVDRSGVLQFQHRYESLGDTATATFDDTGSNIPFHGVSVRFGSRHLHFKVTVQNVGGSERSATNATAIADNPNLGVRPLTITNLLADGDAYAQGLATWLLDRYDDTLAVVSGLTVNLDGLSTGNRNTVTALDIGDVIALNWTPTGTGTQVSQTLAIEGVAYTVDVHGVAEMSFHLSPAVDADLFTLDTSELDGSDILGF